MQTSIQQKLVLVFSLMLFWAGAAFAQLEVGLQEDPYKKPGIWKMLKKMPNNTRLWAEYIGKSVNDFSEEDKQNIQNWRIILKNGQSSPSGPTGGNSTSGYASASSRNSSLNKRIIKPDDRKYLRDIAAIIMLGNPEVAELKKNVQANFLLIEDKFNDMFLNLGMEYKYYDDVHPYGGYSEVRWVEEMERKIHTARLKEVQRVHSRYQVLGD